MLVKVTGIVTSLVLAFVLLLQGNLLLVRLVANGVTIGFAQRMVRSQQDPFRLWLQCPLGSNDRPAVLPPHLQRSYADAAVLATQGTAYWSAGYCAEAAESYAAAASGAPWNEIYWSRLGLMYFAIGNRGASADALGHLADWKSLLSLGNAARRLGTVDLVELCYQLAVDKVPDNLWMAEQLSEIYLFQDEREKAIVLWEDRVNSTTLADPNHWWALGQLYIVQKNYEAAAEAFHQGTVLFPSYALSYREGYAWAQAGEPAKALQAYENALSLAPDDVWALWRAGQMALRLGDQDRACQFLRKTYQLSPNHPGKEEYLANCPP